MMQELVEMEPLLPAALLAVGLCLALFFALAIRLATTHEQRWANPFHPTASIRVVKWAFGGDHRQLSDCIASALVWAFRPALIVWGLIWFLMLILSWTAN